ncbi:hypothetical protein B0H21DRAFT_870651 [Amylocystis lapponica]|nr:hypothetical protein B0H21DRAFT_870651 [Amylocystis lapponica]
MTWLSGYPRRTKRIVWPTDDAELDDADQYLTRVSRRDGSDVFDDRIVHVISLRIPDLKSLVYVADLHENGNDAIVYRKLAILPFFVHRLTLLPSRNGFATLEFNKTARTLTLRVHTEDGVILRQLTESVAAAYGRLVAYGSLLAVCVSSGSTTSAAYKALAGTTEFLSRVDAGGGNTRDFPTNLVGDQLLLWDTTQDYATRVNIPQDPKFPMQHSANFALLAGHKVALAGFLSASFGMNSALLKVFSLDSSDVPAKTFTHGRHPGKPVGILRNIVSQGSSEPSDIIVHSHHNGNRLSVFHADLLTGQIKTTASSRDPTGMIETRRYTSHIRTDSVYISSPFPAHAGNRVLALADPAEEELSEDDEGDAWPPVAHLLLLDFSPTMLQALLELTEEQRTGLATHLMSENAGAQVRVVTRRFVAPASADDEAEDAEYLWPTPRPEAWKEHLLALYELDEARRRGEIPMSTLEYDERPHNHRAVNGLGYVQTRLALPADVDRARVALTSGAVVEVPAPGKEGRAFYFDEASMEWS